MKKLLIIVFLISLVSKAQDKLEDFTGIWNNEKDSADFVIIKKDKRLDLYNSTLYHNDYDDNISVSTISFLKKYYFLKDVISFKENLTKDPKLSSGVFVSIYPEKEKYYDTLYISNRDDLYLSNTSEYKIRPKEFLELYNVNIHYYFYKEKLPFTALKMLFKKGKRDQRNYIKEFLDLNGREITTPKTYIYTAPNLKGKMYLLKGDIVTVLEEEKDFVKFEYETDKGRIITGYLKKEDLE